MKPPQPKNEKRRLEVLWQYDVLDTPAESAFDDLAELAAEICRAPIAIITFVDEQRQWFKARIGLDASETSREISFCGHAILGSDLLIVPDATKDKRFAQNPMVTGEPKIRFYAGAPLINPDGHALGTICVIDKAPRELSSAQQHSLRILARHVVALLELRRKAAQPESETRRIVKGKYQKIFDNALVGIFRTSPEGQYLEANPAIARILGYDSPQEVVNTLKEVGKQLYVDPNRRKVFRQVLESQGSVHDFQAEYFRKDGAKIWVKTTAQVVRDATGKIIFYEGIIQDITAQISAENQLRQSEAQYRMLFDGNPHPMWVFDQKTLQFLEVNDAAIVHYGFSREEFLSMTLNDIRPPEDIPAHSEYHARVLRGELSAGLARRDIWRHRKKDGTIIDVEISWTPIQFQGRKSSLVLANDITERKHGELA
jgi:PAS domain S-box-containing protein